MSFDVTMRSLQRRPLSTPTLPPDLSRIIGNPPPVSVNVIPPGWRLPQGGTALPPAMAHIQRLPDLRESVIRSHAFLEITGLPTLWRWGRAIFANRPIEEVEREYYSQFAPTVRMTPEQFRQEVEERALTMALQLAPLAIPTSRQAAVQLAKALAVGAGIGTGTAAARYLQGYKEEVPKAFFETTLAGTVVSDAAQILKPLIPKPPRFEPPKIEPPKFEPPKIEPPRVDLPSFEPRPVRQFVEEVERALLSARQGDASGVNKILEQVEQWQKMLREFDQLYKKRQTEGLTPDEERRYFDLLLQIDRGMIRDKLAAAEPYLSRIRAEALSYRDVAQLWEAASQMPPGPPRRDPLDVLQGRSLEDLERLLRNRRALENLAKRLGMDPDRLAELAAAVRRDKLRDETVGQLPPDEVRRMLMDEDLLRRYADALGMDPAKLRELLEESLMARISAVPRREPPKPQPPPDMRRPPEPPRSEPPPGTREAPGGRGLVLLLREEPKQRPQRLRAGVKQTQRTAVQTRDQPPGQEQPVVPKPDDVQAPKPRDDQPPKPDQPAGQRDEQTPGQRDKQTAPQREEQEVPQKEEQVTDQTTRQDQVYVVDPARLQLYLPVIIPLVPPPLFDAPASAALPVFTQIASAAISTAVGMPAAVRLPPPPSPDMPLGAYLAGLYGASMPAGQRERYVLL